MDNHLEAFGNLAQDIVTQTRSLLEDAGDFAAAVSSLSQNSTSVGSVQKRDLGGCFWKHTGKRKSISTMNKELPTRITIDQKCSHFSTNRL